MSQTMPADLVAHALAVASHPHARIVAVGEAPAEARQLFFRMNLKVKILALSAVIIPALLILHGMDPTPGRDASASASASASSSSSSSFDAPQAPSAIRLPQPAASAAPLASPPAAPPPPAEGLNKPDRLASALPDQGRGMNSYQIANALMKVDLFAALATAVEDFKRKPYYDPGGLNVGMGYCVTKRLAEYGAGRVRDDLTVAGFAPAQVSALLANKKAEIQKIAVEPIYAIRLLELTKEDYRSLAEAGVGKSTFAKLPPHHQASLTYLAYNTGDVAQFTKLVSAINQGNDSKSMLNMTVNWRDSGGVLHANHRQRSYMQAMFLGPQHFTRALADPNAFESHMATPQAESALADIAGAAQKPDGLRSRLLARRLSGNPWASKALVQEKQDKTPSLNIKTL